MFTEPVFVVGPTAIGKSEIGAELARLLGGEVVGADAFQVYRGLDILTAKPSAATLARVPHHLIGAVSLAESFDVDQYRRVAVERITDIHARGRIPVVVGGSGLYVRSLTHGLAELPAADAALRTQLESQPLPELQARLRELDPAGSALIDLRNPRRVVRALEVCLLTGRAFSSFRQHSEPPKPVRGVFLGIHRESLRQRIEKRAERMFADGVIEEVRGAGEVGLTARQAIGYSEIRQLLAGRIGEDECRQSITVATQQYAKRQMTWFRREKYWSVLEMGDGATSGSVARQIAERLRLTG